MNAPTRMVIGALICTVCSARAASAHPIHTTLTVVTRTSTGVTISIRAFADDFSASVARHAGKRAPADSSAPDADVLRYVRAQFSVVAADGAGVALEPCGVRRDGELYWLCFRAVAGPGARIRNQMLTELHADQVNIVQVEVRGTRKTMLFTKGSVAAVMPG